MRVPCAHFLFCILSSFRRSLPSSSSGTFSLVQRTSKTTRQARNNANTSPYRRSPLRQQGPSPNVPFQSIVNTSNERERAALRDADRERQLALQETPSRRHRRVPQGSTGNENRAPSPIRPRPILPQVLGHRQTPSSGLYSSANVLQLNGHVVTVSELQQQLRYLFNTHRCRMLAPQLNKGHVDVRNSNRPKGSNNTGYRHLPLPDDVSSLLLLQQYFY
ncbi:hypothetical protein C8J57DRAFT_1246237 [Mycena rebaudengoi]|nr:hypothetical protein C8J57DRAFT_1246237 [Mycena rebaudengoi]